MRERLLVVARYLSMFAAVGIFVSFRDAIIAQRYSSGKPDEVTIRSVREGKVHAGDFVHLTRSEWVDNRAELTMQKSGSSTEDVVEYWLLIDPADPEMQRYKKVQDFAEMAGKVKIPTRAAEMSENDRKRLRVELNALETFGKEAERIHNEFKPTETLPIALSLGSRGRFDLPDNRDWSASPPPGTDTKDILSSDQDRALRGLREMIGKFTHFADFVRPNVQYTGMIEALPDKALEGLNSSGYKGPALQFAPNTQPFSPARFILLGSIVVLLICLPSWFAKSSVR